MSLCAVALVIYHVICCHECVTPGIRAELEHTASLCLMSLCVLATDKYFNPAITFSAEAPSLCQRPVSPVRLFLCLETGQNSGTKSLF